jgi:hypothetical protein
MKVNWKKILITSGLLGIYSIILIAITFYIAYSQSQCARINPDGSMDVFVGEVCRQKWKGN